METDPSADLATRHRILIERDRTVGLEAEAEAARAAAARLQTRLDIAEQRLARKNLRIKALNARVAELQAEGPRRGPRLLRRVALAARPRSRVQGPPR